MSLQKFRWRSFEAVVRRSVRFVGGLRAFHSMSAITTRTRPAIDLPLMVSRFLFAGKVRSLRFVVVFCD